MSLFPKVFLPLLLLLPICTFDASGVEITELVGPSSEELLEQITKEKPPELRKRKYSLDSYLFTRDILAKLKEREEEHSILTAAGEGEGHGPKLDHSQSMKEPKAADPFALKGEGEEKRPEGLVNGVDGQGKEEGMNGMLAGDVPMAGPVDEAHNEEGTRDGANQPEMSGISMERTIPGKGQVGTVGEAGGTGGEGLVEDGIGIGRTVTGPSMGSGVGGGGSGQNVDGEKPVGSENTEKGFILVDANVEEPINVENGEKPGIGKQPEGANMNGSNEERGNHLQMVPWGREEREMQIVKVPNLMGLEMARGNNSRQPKGHSQGNELAVSEAVHRQQLLAKNGLPNQMPYVIDSSQFPSLKALAKDGPMAANQNGKFLALTQGEEQQHHQLAAPNGTVSSPGHGQAQVNSFVGHWKEGEVCGNKEKRNIVFCTLEEQHKLAEIDMESARKCTHLGVKMEHIYKADDKKNAVELKNGGVKLFEMWSHKHLSDAQVSKAGLFSGKKDITDRVGLIKSILEKSEKDIYGGILLDFSGGFSKFTSHYGDLLRDFRLELVVAAAKEGKTRRKLAVLLDNADLGKLDTTDGGKEIVAGMKFVESLLKYSDLIITKPGPNQPISEVFGLAEWLGKDKKLDNGKTIKGAECQKIVVGMPMEGAKCAGHSGVKRAKREANKHWEKVREYVRKMQKKKFEAPAVPRILQEHQKHKQPHQLLLTNFPHSEDNQLAHPAPLSPQNGHPQLPDPRKLFGPNKMHELAKKELHNVQAHQQGGQDKAHGGNGQLALEWHGGFEAHSKMLAEHAQTSFGGFQVPLMVTDANGQHCPNMYIGQWHG